MRRGHTPGTVLDDALAAIFHHLYESAAMCDAVGNDTCIRPERGPDGSLTCPAFDAPTQLGATLLLRRGLPVSFTAAHEALETARNMLRCPPALQEILYYFVDDLATEYRARRRFLLALALCWQLGLHEENMEQDEEYRAEYSDPVQDFAKAFCLSPEEVALILPAAQALQALESARHGQEEPQRA